MDGQCSTEDIVGKGHLFLALEWGEKANGRVRIMSEVSL